MSRNKIILSAHQIETLWQTEDAILVKTKKGKIWFCKKMTPEKYQEQVDLFKARKAVEFELRQRGDFNDKNKPF